MVRLKVKEIALNRGLNMAQLARKADIDIRTVRRIFRDPYTETSTVILGKIAEALGVPVTDLLEDVPGKNTD